MVFGGACRRGAPPVPELHASRKPAILNGGMFAGRILLALRCLWSVLLTGNLNLSLRHQLGLIRVASEPSTMEDHDPVPASEDRVRGALQMLRLLQKESGLVDFLTEDLSAYSDIQLAHGVRDMQPAAKDALLRAVRLEPVVNAAEGRPQDLPAYPMQRLADGSLQLEGRPQEFETIHGGLLRHRGWRAAEVNLLTPPNAQDPTIVHPAVYEVE